MKPNKWYLVPMISVALSVCLPRVSYSNTIVFNNFGTGDSFDHYNGSPVAGKISAGEIDIANAFTPTSSGFLSDIWLPVGLVEGGVPGAGGTNALTVWLMADLSGHPGDLLESFQFNNAMGVYGTSSFPILHGAGVGTSIITAGTQYWLVASATYDDTWAAWADSNSSPGSPSYRYDNEEWQSWGVKQSAFRVAVSSSQVPEPGTLLLLGSGLLGLVAAGRKKFRK